MKNEVPEATSMVSQYCLDVLPATKFIESLPRGIEVKAMKFCGYYRGLRKKLAIPEYLKQMGVHTARTTPEHSEINGHFNSGLSSTKMITNLKRIAKSYAIPEARFHILTITLGCKNAAASFRRQYKQIRLPNDKRRKKLVLGMSGMGVGNHIALLAKLSAKKITCTLAKVEKTIVMCSEEMVMKGR
jgi:hypothetical protein